MPGILKVAISVLDADELAVSNATGSDRRIPRPVAQCRAEHYGSVLFLVAARTDEWHAIIVVMERDTEGFWDEVGLVHKPWGPPLKRDRLSQDALGGALFVPGCSMFASRRHHNVVVVAGQAAAGVDSVSALYGDDVLRACLQPESGVFILLGASQNRGGQLVVTSWPEGLTEVLRIAGG